MSRLNNDALRRIIASEPVILGDGSTGVLVERVLIPQMFRGRILSEIKEAAESYRNRDPYWSFMLNMFPEGEEAVRESHRQYLDATSDHFWTVLLMNTFRGNEEILTKGLLQGRLEELNRKAAHNLEHVLRVSGRRNVLTVASIGPSGDCYNPTDCASQEEARALHYAQLHALHPFVDYFLFETFPSAEEMRGALDALRDVNMSYADRGNGARMAGVSFVLIPDAGDPTRMGKILDGSHPGAVMERIKDEYCDVVLYGGFNCSPPEAVLAGLRRVGDYDPSLLPFIRDVHINPSETDPAHRAQIQGVQTLPSEEFVRFYEQLDALFPHVIFKWGCCGIFPEHIRALHDYYHVKFPDHKPLQP
ncbi:MAG: homocysteine S-methyltransferase family protein [Nanoarchaeota archaeon]